MLGRVFLIQVGNVWFWFDILNIGCPFTASIGSWSWQQTKRNVSTPASSLYGSEAVQLGPCKSQISSWPEEVQWVYAHDRWSWILGGMRVRRMIKETWEYHSSPSLPLLPFRTSGFAFPFCASLLSLLKAPMIHCAIKSLWSRKAWVYCVWYGVPAPCN